MALRYTSYYEVDAFGNGRLPCGTPISTYNVEDSFPPLDLSHTNLLHIFFNNYAKKEVVCARKGVTLNEWLAGDPSPLNSCTVKNKSEELPGDKDVNAISFSVHLRNFIGGMVRGVCYLHKRGHSVKDLNEENICIVDGELKLWKMNLVKTSMESQNQNFSSVADIISSTILQLSGNLEYECPPDVTNLLNLLRSDRAALHKKRILHHMAMISPEMRLMLVNEMFQMGRCVETENKWRNAADVFFVEANLNDWEVKYKEKMIGHVANCYNYRNVSAPYTVKLDEDGHVEKFDVVDSFLNFLRNIVHHVGHDREAGTRLTKEAIDAILFWGFGNEIILFMECLDRFGLALTFLCDE